MPSLPDDLEELNQKSQQAATAPTGLENRTAELESGLDTLEQQSTVTPADQGAEIAGVASPDELLAKGPTGPAPEVSLTSPENQDISDRVQLGIIAQGTPQAPKVSWDKLKSSPGFTNLSPADKTTVLQRYANESRDYLSSLEGSDPNAVDKHIAGFLTTQHNDLFPPPPPDNNILHNIFAGGARLGADTIKGTFNALSGLARKAAEDNKNPGILDRITSAIVPGDTGTREENRKQALQFLTDAADFWKDQAAKVTGVEQANPLLSNSKGAKVGELAAGLVGPVVMGLPGFIAQHRLQSYGETYNETGDHFKAERAANLASIGDMLFMGQAEGITHGLESVLAKQGVSGIKAWAVKAAAATSGNVGVSQLTKAAQAAADAPGGDRAKAFSEALNKVDLTDAGIQTAFGLLAAGSPTNRSRKITEAHQDLQADQSRAAEMDTAGLPTAAVAIRETAKADFEKRLAEVDQLPGAEKTVDEVSQTADSSSTPTATPVKEAEVTTPTPEAEAKGAASSEQLNAATQRPAVEPPAAPATEESASVSQTNGEAPSAVAGPVKVAPEVPLSTERNGAKTAEAVKTEESNGAKEPKVSQTPESELNAETPPPGEKIVTVRRPDGSTYEASFGGKYWEFPGREKRASIGKFVEGAGWSHGMLGKGEEIVEGNGANGEQPKAEEVKAPAQENGNSKREADIEHAKTILERNPIRESDVAAYRGDEPFRKGGHGISQDVWKEAWQRAEKVTVNGKLLKSGNGDASTFEQVFSGKPSEYKPKDSDKSYVADIPGKNDDLKRGNGWEKPKASPADDRAAKAALAAQGKTFRGADKFTDGKAVRVGDRVFLANGQDTPLLVQKVLGKQRATSVPLHTTLIDAINAEVIPKAKTESAEKPVTTKKAPEKATEKEPWESSQEDYVKSQEPVVPGDVKVYQSLYRRSVYDAVKAGELSPDDAASKLGGSTPSLESAARQRASDIAEFGDKNAQAQAKQLRDWADARTEEDRLKNEAAEPQAVATKKAPEEPKPTKKLISKWHEKYEAEQKKASTTKLVDNGSKSVEAAPVNSEGAKLTDIANETRSGLDKIVKLPKGATAVRVIDSKGRKILLKASDLRGANPLHEAGPFKKVEAGTIAKGNVFNPIKEEIGLRSVLSDEEAFGATEAERGAKSEKLPSAAEREEVPLSSEELAKSEVPASEQAHQRATASALSEEMGDKAPTDLADKVAANYAHFNKTLNDRGLQRNTAAREAMFDRLRDDLLSNVEKTGSPFKTINSKGEEVTYNAIRRSSTKLQDYLDLHENAKRAATPLHADEETEGRSVEETVAVEEVAEPEGEHPQAETVRSTINRHFNSFIKSVNLPESTNGIDRAGILKAAHFVYDQLLQQATGHSLGIGDSADLRGNPKWGKLVNDPQFRKAVQERVADRIRQDLRATVPKDREGLRSTEIKMGFGDIIDADKTKKEYEAARPALRDAAEQVKAGTPIAVVTDSLPENIKARVQKAQTDYNARDGMRGAMEQISKIAASTPDERLQKAYAEALKGSVSAGLEFDPTLQERRGAGGQLVRDGNKVQMSPFLSPEATRWTLLHEAGHDVRAAKIDAFQRGEFYKLDARDQAVMREGEQLRQFLLQHADVSQELRDASDLPSGSVPQELKWNAAVKADKGSTRLYPLLSLHELFEGISNPAFREWANKIDASGVGRSALQKAGATVWDVLKRLVRTLTFGGKAVDENSALARAFDLSIDLAKTGRLEDQTAARALQPKPEDAFRRDQQAQVKFLNGFAREHGINGITQMAVEHPDLFNQAAELYRNGVSQTKAPGENPILRSVATEPEVQDETAKRAAGMFKLIDSKNLAQGSAEQIVRDAMTNGAATAEDFSKAFQNAGVKPEAADAIGGLVQSHFTLAAHDKATGLNGEVSKAAAERMIEAKQPATEDIDGEPTITSIQNATVDKERAARGLPSAVKAARKEFGETWLRALDRIDKDPEAPANLVTELKQKARPLTDEENAMLLHRQITLQNDYRDAAESMVQEHESGNFDTKEENRLKLARVSDDLLDLYNAERKAGTEQGRGLATRKMLANENYELANMITEKRAVNNGAELNEAQTAEITRLHKRIFDLNSKLVDRINLRDEEASQRQGEDAVEDMRKRTRMSPAGDLDAQRRDIVQGMRDQMAETGDPTDLRRYAQKLAENYIRRGIDKLQTVSRAVHEVIQTIAPELNERQVRDMISGYGDFKQLDQDAIKVKMRDLKGKLQQAAKLDDMLQQAKAPSKTGIERRSPSDHERNLLKLVNEAKKTGDFNVTDPATQLKGALDAIKTRLKNQIKDLGFRLETGEKPLKREGVAYDAEAEQLRSLRDRIQETLKAVEGKPELSDEQRIKIAKDALQKQIDDYNRRLNENDFSTKERKAPISTPELEAMRAERDALKAQYQEFEALEHPERKLERAVAAWRTRSTNRIADYQQRLAGGDFAPRKVREPLKLTNPEDLKLKAELERAKNEFELGKRKDMMANRTKGEKSADALAKWGRATKLTAVSTLGKLVLAAAHRAATTPIEDAIGEVLGHIPGVSKVAELAPREGGFNIKAEARAVSQGLTQGIIDGYDIITKGRSDLDELFGKKLQLPREWYDWAGGIWHGALKAPIKRAEYERSLYKRLEKAEANGEDISDPLVQESHMLAAYKDANSAIFLQDNRVVSAYKRALSAFEEKQKATGNVSVAGKAAATTARVLVPIVKVPTNYVAEAFTHAFGVVSGSYRLARALSKGIENLHPDEADAIMRHLKKGSLGAAVMLLGFFNPAPNAIQAGGYYQSGEKRKPGDVEAGGLRLFGYDVPKFAAHTPLLETLQLGATARRVMEAQMRKGTGKAPALGAGAWAGAMGLADEAPFFETMADWHKLTEAPGQYFGDLAKGVVVPAALNNIAVWTDRQNGKQVKRKPKNVIQSIESGIPGLRQHVSKSPRQ